MKRFLVQAIALIILIFGALAYYTGKLPSLQPTSPITGEKLGEAKINNIRINIEVADTPEKRKRGLGGRQSLASDSGMLFIFEKQDKYSLWMKGMKFPLDFIWIEEKKIVDITKDAKVPEPSTKDENLSVYQPNTPVDSVLEVNSGFVDSQGIKIGDNIDIIR